MAQRQVRIKKLSKQTGQQILREEQIDDYDSLQSSYTGSTQTGVERGEEQVKKNISHSVGNIT